MLNTQYGENSAVAKLTNDQSLEIIRRNLAGERHKTLAEEFCVSPATISKLVRGLRWNGLQSERRQESRRQGTGNHLARLNEEKVREIRQARASGQLYREISRRYDVSPSTLAAIVKGRTWKHVT